MRIAGLLVISLLLSVVACSKQAAPATTPAAPTESATPAATTPPPASTGQPIATLQEYEDIGIALLEKIAAALAGAGTDCDKMAADFTKVIDDNQAQVAAMKAYEKEHPEADKSMSDDGRARVQKIAEPMIKSLEPCMNHPGVKAAIDRMEN